LTDIVVQATVTYNAGSDSEQGLATLKAKGNLESRMTLLLASGAKEEIRNGPAGVWSGEDQQPHAMAYHNCQNTASWFLPHFAVSSALTVSGYTVSYLGQEERNGTAFLHLHVAGGPSADALPDFVRGLSATDLFLDPVTFLPALLSYNLHPDSDASRDMPVEISFEDYQLVNGLMIPSHVLKLVQGSVLFDFRVTGTTVNSGLPDSDFQIAP
jgi:hypothetical protein